MRTPITKIAPAIVPLPQDDDDEFAVYVEPEFPASIWDTQPAPEPEIETDDDDQAAWSVASNPKFEDLKLSASRQPAQPQPAQSPAPTAVPAAASTTPTSTPTTIASAAPQPAPTAFTFDKSVQQDILQWMLTSPEVTHVAAEWLEPGYFAAPAHRTIAAAILGFYKAYAAPPTVPQIRTELVRRFSGTRDGDDLLTEADAIFARPLSPTSQQYIVDLVSQFAEDQSYRQAILKAVPLLQQGKREEVRDLMREATQKTFALDTGVYWYMESLQERTAVRKDSSLIEARVIPTGIQELDCLMRYGGPCKGEIGLVIAPTNRGKSIALGQFARRGVWERENVLLLTLEMERDKYADRLDAGFTATEMWDVNEDPDALYGRMLPIAKRFPRGLAIKRYPTKRGSIEDFNKLLEQLYARDRWKPGLIVLDYLDLVRPARDREDKWSEKEELMEDFRGLCGQWDAVGWTATQTNRTGADAKIVRNKHVKGAWDSLGPVDYIVTVSVSDDDKKANRVNLCMDKNRDGLAQIYIPNLEADWGRMCFVKRSDMLISDQDCRERLLAIQE